MIVAYTGKLGSGKTYTMTKDIVKALNKGTKVYSNYKIFWFGKTEKRTYFKRFLKFVKIKKQWHDFPKENLQYWSETEELLHLDNGIVAIDEGSVYLNSRNWALLDPEFQRKILQSRKDGLHIYFTAQRIGQIDITLRNLVNTFYVSKFINLFGFKFFLLDEFDIDNSGELNIEDRLSTRFVKLNVKQRFYDTNEKIASIISTMANLARQADNRSKKELIIRKYEEQVNIALKEQGYDVTVSQILDGKLKSQEVSADSVPEIPDKQQGLPKKKVDNKSIKLPKLRKLTVRTA